MIYSLLGGRSGARAFLRAVLGPALFTIRHTLGIERAAYRVVPNARKVLNPATADQYDRVFLKVMADAWDVGGNFETVCQANAANLTERRIRLLRSRGINAGADAPALWAAFKRGRLRLPGFIVAALTDQLIDRRHELQFYLSDKNPEDKLLKTILSNLLTACITDTGKVGRPTVSRRLQSKIGQGTGKLVARREKGKLNFQWAPRVFEVRRNSESSSESSGSPADRDSPRNPGQRGSERL